MTEGYELISDITETEPCDAPIISILSGILPSERITAAALAALGFHMDPAALTKVVLDLPRGYALHTLKNLDRFSSTVIIVTWNTCPEYMEDLRDLQPNGLISGQFFLRRDLGEALHEILDQVSQSEYFHFTLGPKTVLTPEEREVLRFAARGWNNRRIGEQIGIGEQTVKNRLGHSYKKLGIHNHVQAALYYWGIQQEFR